MFTGLIEATGTVGGIEPTGGDVRLLIEAPALREGTALGDSVAVNGACLTVARIDGASLAFDVSRETLQVTTLGTLVGGARVNLERALRAGARLGGHLVSGHVDGIAEVASVRADARSTRITFIVPAGLRRYLARKGSACVDGVSLTVNELTADGFGVNLVPHTLAMTTLGKLVAGRRVNLEVDLLARYLEQLLRHDPGLANQG